ncbi:hypothetical protein KR054_005989 [Drosophila jambulina]|nr:hypothetical protein KR054_005989 [Drosophila jambulina]
MRSRTELVTTTFVESDEDDFSPDDDSDSEEDWRPTKKRPAKAAGSDGGRKRKSAASTASKAKRRMAKVSDDDSENDDDLETDPSDDDFDYPSASTSSKKPQSLPPKKQFVKLNQLDLLVKKSDLMEKDWLKNNRLCLWRKDDETTLLQKYLRVKSGAEEEELLFTSSSVYSSWDEQQTSDFVEVKVNCLDPNNRRIKLQDLEAVKKISEELQLERETSAASDKEDDAEEGEDEKPNDAD